MTPTYKVGKTYLTQRGEAVRVVAHFGDMPGYETTLGDDGVHRYDRSTPNSDTGRCTGSAHDYSNPENFARPPVEVMVVPIAITGVMHAAAVRTIVRCTGNDDFPPRVWRAMLGAAPREMPSGNPGVQNIEGKSHG